MILLLCCCLCLLGSLCVSLSNLSVVPRAVTVVGTKFATKAALSNPYALAMAADGDAEGEDDESDGADTTTTPASSVPAAAAAAAVAPAAAGVGVAGSWADEEEAGTFVMLRACV